MVRLKVLGIVALVAFGSFFAFARFVPCDYSPMFARRVVGYAEANPMTPWLAIKLFVGNCW